jgi:hypothetical protein
MTRRDDAVDAGGACHPRAMRYEVGRRHVADALLFEIGLLEIGENGHRQQLQLARAATADGRVERLAVGPVDRQIVEAEARDVGGRFLDGIRDVEQLHVEEHGLAGGLEALGELEAAAEQQFEPNFVAGHGVAERRHQDARAIDARDIEGDEEAVAGG